MINQERLRKIFLELVSFNSPHGLERDVNLYCAELLRDAGFVCQHDAAGNLIAQKAGSITDAPRIFYSAHTDTVQPTVGLVVREVDGVFRTSGDTILGADDKAAVAEILEAMLVLEEQQVPHGDLQVIFSVGEEVGLVGAQALAPAVIAGGIGFVFDASGATGTIITGAPTHDLMTAKIRGKAAHAGFAPEKGVSALRIAARAIDRMRLGRIDPETTANVGIIQGGTANNIVAEDAVVHLEARSRNVATLDEQVRHMRECLEEAAAHYGGEMEIDYVREYLGYQWHEDDVPLLIAAEAWRRTGGEPGFRQTGGGSDGNVFNARGVPCVVLTCGYADAHSVNEHVALSEMVAAANWAVEIARVIADGSVI